MTREEEQCACEVLETVPAVMRFIRAEMRRHRAAGLSVPQFRTLAFLERSDGASLGEVAESLGLTAPSACALIDTLEDRGMVSRAGAPDDRRRLLLALTAPGREALALSRQETQKRLSAVLAGLEAQETAAVTGAMKALHRVFAVPAKVPAHGDT
jgi:DNA-binding MarR family transcriptional regulator